MVPTKNIVSEIIQNGEEYTPFKTNEKIEKISADNIIKNAKIEK